MGKKERRMIRKTFNSWCETHIGVNAQEIIDILTTECGYDTQYADTVVYEKIFSEFMNRVIGEETTCCKFIIERTKQLKLQEDIL